ncbi:MAG: GNAT family N-acetyltransferase [Ruminiclostridium sp.]|nr:GNAT family N-acetyltransferase [Ruminiclostridium sp.]
MNLVIQTLVTNRIALVIEELHKHHISRSVEYLKQCLAEQELGKRATLIAFLDDVPVGTVHLIYRSQYPGFYENNIPEINDLVVAEPFQRKGIGRKLIQACEVLAKEKGYTSIGLGVGLYKDYGKAQRLYPSMGYIPDGKGLMYKNLPVAPGTHVYVDDDLIIYLVKKLDGNSVNSL